MDGEVLYPRYPRTKRACDSCPRDERHDPKSLSSGFQDLLFTESMRVCVCVFTFVHMHICIHKSLNTHIYVYIYISIYI